MNSIEETLEWLDEPGTVECPVCGKMTADEKDGEWICHDGCKLSQYYYCPRCNELYIGAAGYCDRCIQDI